ncbi:MAG: hypothetical protein WD960_02480 [Gemmatimonadota bacterium]
MRQTGRRHRNIVPALTGFAILFPLGVGGLVACGNLTAGGVAEVEVVIASDEGGTEELRGVRASLASGPVRIGPAAGLDGSFQLEVSVSLLNAAGEEVGLTEGVQTVEGTLGSGSRVDLTVTGVPSGSYTGFRATFHRVEAEVSDLPGGGPASGSARVDLSTAPVTVQAERQLDLEEGDRVRLVVDLRTGAWLQGFGTLPPGPFQNAVRFEVEPRAGT